MSIVEDNQKHQDLEDQARQWFMRLEEDAGNDELRDAFMTWYEQDENHREAYEQVASFWLDVDEMLEDDLPLDEMEGYDFGRITTEENDGDISLSGSDPEAGSRNITYLPSAAAETKAPVFSRAFIRIAATIAILVTVAFSYYGYSSYLPEGTYRTNVGEQTEVVLADGSRVFMNTDSLLREEYSQELRKVVLLRGEAIFDVEKDPGRPFVVETDYGTAQAVGTSFSVYDRDDKVEVIVIEGTVAVHRNADLEEIRQASEREKESFPYVSGGQKIFAYGDHLGVVGPASDLDLDRLDFSRQGKVIFRGQPLSEIVKEMARYTNKKIIITDKGIKQMKMGGAFDINDFDAFINAVEDAFPVKVIRVTPFVTFITEA